MVISQLFGLFEQVVDHELSLAPWLLLMFHFYVGYTGPWALTFDDERSPLTCDTLVSSIMLPVVTL